MFMVTARITKINFAMLNDWVRPIGDIERSVWPHLHIDWAEGNVCGAHDIGHLFRDVAGILIVDRKADNTMGSKIAGNKITLPVRRKMFTFDSFETREFWIISRTDTIENSARASVSDV